MLLIIFRTCHRQIFALHPCCFLAATLYAVSLFCQGIERQARGETGLCGVKPGLASPASHQVEVLYAVTDSFSRHLILAGWILRPLRFLHSLPQMHIVRSTFWVDNLKSILFGISSYPLSGSPRGIYPLVDLSLNWVPPTERCYLGR